MLTAVAETCEICVYRSDIQNWARCKTQKLKQAVSQRNAIK